MPTITLPDGSKREFAGAVDGARIAASIGPRLAQAAVAVRVNGVLRDLTAAIAEDASIAIITREPAEGVAILRHDASPASRARKSSGSKTTCMVPSRYGVLSWYRTFPPAGVEPS